MHAVQSVSQCHSAQNSGKRRFGVGRPSEQQQATAKNDSELADESDGSYEPGTNADAVTDTSRTASIDGLPTSLPFGTEFGLEFDPIFLSIGIWYWSSQTACCCEIKNQKSFSCLGGR